MTTPVGASLELDDDVLETVGADLGVQTVTTDALNSGWITREDFSLRKKLIGGLPFDYPVLSVEVANEVTNASGDTEVSFQAKRRKVPVYFRLPEDELRRTRYPYVTIDYLTFNRLTEQEHRGPITWKDGDDGYTPPGLPLTPGDARTEIPVPYMLEYQITTWARWTRHDRDINVQLAITPRIEPRFGFLEILDNDDVPGVPVGDRSVRRMDLLSGPVNGDTRDADGKRLFRKMYTVGIYTELFHVDFVTLQKVQRVVIDPARQAGFDSV